jgi:hypothetical protein
VAWIATIVFYNVTGISKAKPGSDWAKGSVFKTIEGLEAIAAGLSSSRRRKNVERLKLFIEKLSETSSQKSEKSRSG